MSSIKLSSNPVGTGSLTIAAPNTNTDRTLTLPDESGTLLTSASPVVSQKGVPAFRAYPSVTQSISNGTETLLIFNTETFDTTSAYDTSTYKFQPNVAGYYEITINAAVGSGVNVLPVLYKNGSRYNYTSISSADRATGTSLVYLNGTTDYVQPYLYQNSGGTRSTNGGSENMFFQGFLVAKA